MDTNKFDSQEIPPILFILICVIIHKIHLALNHSLLCLNRRRHSFNTMTVRYILDFTINACAEQN